MLFGLVLAGCGRLPQHPPEGEPDAGLEISHTRNLIERGYAYYEDQEYAEALENYHEALASAGMNDLLLRADIHYRIGNVHYKQQRYDKSLSAFQEALVLLQKDGTDADKAVVLNSIGNSYHTLGRVEAARDNYLQALAIRRELGDKEGIARTLINLGSTYLAQGRYAQALEQYDQAKKLAETMEPRNLRIIGAARIHSGSLYAELGQYDKALAFHEQALRVYEDARYTSGVATALHNIGYTHAEQDNYPEAIEAFRKAVSLKEMLHDQYGKADTLNSLGLTLAEHGKTGEALRMLEEALHSFRELNARKQIAATLDSIGSVYKLLGEYPKALDYYDQSLVISRQLGDRDGERITLGNIGLVLELQDKIDLAIIFYKLSVNITQAIRKELVDLPRQEQRAYAKRIEGTYRRLANLLVDRGRLLEAEEILAMLKEEEFFEFMHRRGDLADAGSTVATFTKTEDEWARRYAEISRELIATGREYEELKGLPDSGLSEEQKRRLEELKSDMETARQAFRAFLEELKEAFLAQGPQRAMEFGEKDFKNLRQVQAALKDLGPGAVLIHFLFTDDRLRLLVTTDTQQVHRDSHITWNELNELIAAFRQTLQNRFSNPYPQAKILYDYLIEPIEGDLRQADAHTLLISLDDTLRYLPFAALFDGCRYLSERYELVVYTAAARGHLTDSPQTAWRVSGFGVSEKSGDEFGSLPAVLRELNFIVREERQDDLQGVFPGVVRLNSDFTAEQLSEDLREGYPVVHIASHFKFRPGKEADSFLLLGSNQKLTLADLLDGDFPLTDVDLLALSACETAYGGRDAHGKEIESFGVLAQQMGAKAVIATLWPVDDSSTADLMAAFYQRRLEGMTKAGALRQAQLAFLKGNFPEAESEERNPENRTAEILDPAGGSKPSTEGPSYTHPYFWAPFILMGNFL